MRLKVLAVGTRPPDWVRAGFEEYARRMPHGLEIELAEVAAPVRGSSDSARSVAEEARRLLAKVARGDRIVALDVAGRTSSTESLAKRLDDWRTRGGDVAFLIGGADGLHPSCLEAAHETLSLSALTFPHMLVRVILAEQLYRAWTLLEGHPYHRA